MKNAPENLYLMADGTYAAPGDVSKKDGVLRHKNGVHVALRDNGEPYTIGYGLATNKNVEAAEVGVSDAAPPDVVVDTKPKSETEAADKKAEVLDPDGNPPSDKAPAIPDAKAAKAENR